MISIELRHALSEGLSSWLMFEHHAGRDELFSERYLALPVGQILQRFTGGKVIAESNHPILTTPRKTGRPPQLDFVVNDQGKVVLVLESKWAAKTGVSTVDVLWDCVRLELAAHHYGCDALFVLAGTRKRVEAVLKSRSFSAKNAKMEATKALHLHGSGKLSVKIRSLENNFSIALHAVLRKYPGVAWPSEINCGSGVQIPKLAADNAYTAVVWHIQPVSKLKRRPFQVMSEAETKAARSTLLTKMKAQAAAKLAWAKKSRATAALGTSKRR